MFEGYSDQTIDFLWGIRLNNERTWFEQHKGDFITCLQLPTRQLAEEVFAKMCDRFPEMPFHLHISRIYRDARRLHGRGPYKDHLWFTLRCAAERESENPSFYFEVMPEGYSYGMGFFQASASTMERYRKRINQNPEPMTYLAEQFQAQNVFCLTGPEYVRKKGNVSALLAPWYQKKRVVLSRDCSFDAVSHSSALVETLVDGFSLLMPYFQFFDELTKQAE